MKKLKELLFQLVPVAIGVYIGILAGNLNEKWNHRANQKEFIANLIQEIELNKKRIQYAENYHKELKETMDSLMDVTREEELSKPFMKNNGFAFIPGWTGVHTPALESSVFDSGLIGNLLQGLDFETVSKISRVYNFQKEYKDITKPIINRLWSMNFETPTNEALTIAMILGGDIQGIESGMVKGYDQLIEHLKEINE
jgi:hypothetical protein